MNLLILNYNEINIKWDNIINYYNRLFEEQKNIKENINLILIKVNENHLNKTNCLKNNVIFRNNSEKQFINFDESKKHILTGKRDKHNNDINNG